MKAILTLLIILFVTSVIAQEKRFIFIQTDNRQPFYVSLNGKIYSSTASGYVIIPKLAEGEYKFSIGFAKNEIPEQVFQYAIHKNDIGLNLKNFGDKGWGLFNLQSLAVTMASGVREENLAVKNEIVVDEPISFKVPVKEDVRSVAVEVKENIKQEMSHNAIAKEVVDVKEQPVTMIDTVSSLVKNETPVTTLVHKEEPVDRKELQTVPAVSTVVATEVKEPLIDTLAPAVSKRKKVIIPGVQKLTEQENDYETVLTFVDQGGKNTDTINVVIPVSVPEANNLTLTNKTQQEPAVENEPVDVVPVVNSPVETSPVVSFQCSQVASEDDYTKLRRRMARQTSDEAMMEELEKFYKNKCFTTAQVRALSTLFLSDEGRFRFFDVSRSFVSDPGEYASLETEFIDPSYLSRFRQLLGGQ